jgi:hypothetical protein
VDKEGSILHQGVTGQFPPGTWQRLEFAFDSGAAEGEYTLSLLAQALRGDAFVDLSSLSKRVAFFFDFSAPVEPQVSPSGGLYNIAVPVALSHQEWVAPTGSPVSVYYTTDHTDPTAGSSRYLVGAPVVLELSATATEIRAIAIDDSGRKSAIISESYSFIEINGMQEAYVDTTVMEQFVHPQGFGLSSVISAEFFDSNGTSVRAEVMGSSEIAATVAVYISNMLSPGSDGIFQGNGTTADGLLRLFDASGISDAISVDLRPEPP